MATKLAELDTDESAVVAAEAALAARQHEQEKMQEEPWSMCNKSNAQEYA